MIIRAILADWAKAKHLELPKVQEGEFTDAKISELNALGYNIYFLPNYPSEYDPSRPVDGTDIDKFKFVFVDFDLKSGSYPTKEDFLEEVGKFPLQPTRIVDSGNGIHVYWEVGDLDAMTYLRLQRRLIRKFNTDEAVGKIYQLMREPDTYNTKEEGNFKKCSVIFDSYNYYSAEQLSNALPMLLPQDEEYCKQHYEKTYTENKTVEVSDKLPVKFGELLRKNKEVKELWGSVMDDRSKADYRIAHIMFANGFTKAEAMSVLVNCQKALSRAPKHRVGYAENIVEKIWTYEVEGEKAFTKMSSSVKDILMQSGDNIKGTRFPCYTYIDNTVHGFRLGQVIGLVGGSGVGKTAVALNMFMGFVESNPDYDHFFIPLEQPANEIAERWKYLCGDRTELHSKVHILSNYDDEGGFRHLSLDEIKEYILEFQKQPGQPKIGCVVIDHVGALKKKGKMGENQDLMDICHAMKAFAVQTGTMLVMQSQTSREKAGIGDLELNKDAAYGTMYFEAYCDYMITLWQPLKRCHKEPDCPTTTAIKFCKIRHKKKGDVIQEDVPYILSFDADTGHLRPLTEIEEKQFNFFNNQALNKRKKDRKTDLVEYTNIPTEIVGGGQHGEARSN